MQLFSVLFLRFSFPFLPDGGSYLGMLIYATTAIAFFGFVFFFFLKFRQSLVNFVSVLEWL
jgi:hypothetical protein